jgi:hypothetical protein
MYQGVPLIDNRHLGQATGPQLTQLNPVLRAANCATACGEGKQPLDPSRAAAKGSTPKRKVESPVARPALLANDRSVVLR